MSKNADVHKPRFYGIFLRICLTFQAFFLVDNLKTSLSQDFQAHE